MGLFLTRQQEALRGDRGCGLTIGRPRPITRCGFDRFFRSVMIEGPIELTRAAERAKRQRQNKKKAEVHTHSSAISSRSFAFISLGFYICRLFGSSVRIADAIAALHALIADGYDLILANEAFGAGASRRGGVLGGRAAAAAEDRLFDLSAGETSLARVGFRPVTGLALDIARIARELMDKANARPALNGVYFDVTLIPQETAARGVFRHARIADGRFLTAGDKESQCKDEEEA